MKEIVHVLSPMLRKYAQRVALASVTVAVVLNTIADYQQRVPGGLKNWQTATERFDPLALGLAVVESFPLAALAYAMATLLHLLAEEERAAPEAGHIPGWGEQLTEWWAGVWRRSQASYARPGVRAPAIYVTSEPARQHAGDAPGESIPVQPLCCPTCGIELTRAQWLAARRWGHCKACRSA